MQYIHIPFKVRKHIKKHRFCRDNCTVLQGHVCQKLSLCIDFQFVDIILF